eukprot:symbB.v1.2.038629.t2/scaffold6089.1/size21010/1
MALTENMQDSYSYPIQEATKAEVQARYFPQGDQKDGQLQLVPGDIVWVLAENEGWYENTGWFPLSVIRKLQRGDCIDEEEEERKNSALFTSDHRAIASPQAKHRKVSAAQAELAETKQRLEAVTPAKLLFTSCLSESCLGPFRPFRPFSPFGHFTENWSRKSVQEALSQSSDSHIYLVRSFGRSSSFREMTCGQLEQLLPNLNSCRLVLAADDPELHTYSANAGPWGSRIIMGVKGAERQIAFIDQISPPGTSLMIFDDNILKFMDCGKTLETDLPDLIRLGFSEMHGAKAKIWSGSDSPNPAHWSADADIGMGLVYGACFGMVATHEESRYSRYGQVMDDIERSCRFYEHDGATVRLGRLQVYKRHAPGIYHKSKGGISASLSAEEFKSEALAARLALLKSLSPSMSFVIFNQAEAERSRLDEQALQKAHGESENERQRLLKKCDEFQNKAQSLQDECKRKEEELRLQKDQHRQAEAG